MKKIVLALAFLTTISFAQDRQEKSILETWEEKVGKENPATPVIKTFIDYSSSY